MVFFDVLDPHSEAHRAEHAGWLRAAVLGSNDGLVSTASLMVGVAAAGASSGTLVTAGLAVALHQRDPLEAHPRDELGHTDAGAARPVLAACASAASFLIGGLFPFLGLLANGSALRPWTIVGVTRLGLMVAGVTGARIAGGAVARPALRVLLGGAAAMAITALVGQIAHVSGL